ncbi:MAG: chemotaxis protein CheW [bacterium]
MDETKNLDDSGTLHMVTFRVGSSLLGVQIELVKEIHNMLGITEVPGAHGIFMGMVNLRGKIVTVIDMNVVLGQKEEPAVNPKLLFLKTTSELLSIRGGDEVVMELGYENEDTVGLFIDRIEETIVIDSQAIRPVPSNLDEKKKMMLNGVIKNNNELILLLNVTRVLNRCRDGFRDPKQSVNDHPADAV